MTAAEWVMLLALSVLWGGSFFFTGIAVKELPPLTIVVLRVGLAAAMLYLALRLLGVSLPRERRAWIAFFGMGLAQQCDSVLPDRVGPDPHCLGARRDPQRHDAVVHRGRCARL